MPSKLEAGADLNSYGPPFGPQTCDRLKEEEKGTCHEKLPTSSFKELKR